MMGFGFFVPILFIGIVIFMVVVFGREFSTSSGKALEGDPRTAEKILDERYAKGEISREQYKEMRTDIG